MPSRSILFPSRKTNAFSANQPLSLKQWYNSDNEFNQLYPASVRPFAQRHWTPLAVADQVADFLGMETGARILDIGSGVGKFCLGAAYYKPGVNFFGIEQRKDAIDCAENAKKILGLENVCFLHGNFTQLNLQDYDHFYFYNSFYENLSGTDRLDDSIVYSVELYNYYNHYLCKELEKMPSGTKLATFHSLEYEVPASFHVIGSEMDSQLKFWIKE
jgi:SAM-dependent methyltransferase